MCDGLRVCIGRANGDEKRRRSCKALAAWAVDLDKQKHQLSQLVLLLATCSVGYFRSIVKDSSRSASVFNSCALYTASGAFAISF